MNNDAVSRKGSKPRPRFGIATKLLVSFLVVLVVSFAVVGLLVVLDMEDMGRFAEESSTTLGNTAARDSTSAMEELGESAMKQKALDVSKQVEIYLAAHPGIPPQDMSQDPGLAQIAVQPVGETGYTCLYEKVTGIMRVHPSPGLINYDMHNLSESLPSFWVVFKPSLRCTVFSGYYDWEDEDGDIRPKFMYMVPVEGTTYMVAATTYIDEFSEPVIATKDRIVAASSETAEHIDGQIRSTRNLYIALFSGVLVVVAGLVFWVSRRITNPIKTLARSSEIIGGGNLDHRVEIRTGDELEELADSFNKMAVDLKKYTEELRLTTAEKERMQRELEIAKGIQQSFLPELPPRVEGFDLAALNVPAQEVGGDFYDFIPIGGENWGLVIADVSGKGIPAALFMALSRTLVRANTIGTTSVSQAIQRANDLIAEHERTSMFVTLFCGMLDPKRRTLTYVSAGHNPPLKFASGGGDTIMLKARGIALGIMPDIRLEEQEITLDEGDILVLYTDGVTEAIDDKEGQFGQDRLNAAVQRASALPASEIIERVVDEVNEFSQGQPQFDDITLMIVKVL